MNFLFLLTTLLLLIRWVLLKPALMRFKTSLTPVVPKVCLEIWLTKSPKSKLQLITMLMHLVIEFLVQFACRLVFTLYIVNTTRCLYLELNISKIVYCDMNISAFVQYIGLYAWRDSKKLTSLPSHVSPTLHR